MPDTPANSAHSAQDQSEITIGYLYAVGGFFLWGVFPVFWKTLDQVPALELLGHRVVWCSLLMLGILGWRRGWGTFRRLFDSKRTVFMLGLSTALIAFNWFIFVYAVISGHIVEASLGYFINPLFTVVLGMIFLGERLRRWQGMSVALATFGVIILTLNLGALPWISLALPASFGLYGLVRKTVAASPEDGLTFEVWLMLPLALIYLSTLEDPAFGQGGVVDHLLLMCTGLVTALPLILFTHGARRLPLSTIGVLQYLAPTLQFLLGVFVYGENFTRQHLLAYSFIWLALIVFSLDARRAAKEVSAARLQQSVAS